MAKPHCITTGCVFAIPLQCWWCLLQSLCHVWGAWFVIPCLCCSSLQSLCHARACWFWTEALTWQRDGKHHPPGFQHGLQTCQRIDIGTANMATIWQTRLPDRLCHPFAMWQYLFLSLCCVQGPALPSLCHVFDILCHVTGLCFPKTCPGLARGWLHAPPTLQTDGASDMAKLGCQKAVSPTKGW
jgi:hypothetical protein